MRVKFLIQIAPDNQQLWIARCPAISKESAPYSLREEGIENLRKQLTLFLEIEGKKYLSTWEGSDEIVSCPEGFIELPIDLWKCKLSETLCPTQAQVFITNKPKFLSVCLAPEARKESIFETIKSGDYDGFHHVPGRYKCPLCRGKESMRYFYPWELTSLAKFFDLDSAEFRKTFLEANVGLAAYGSGLCAKHIKEVMSKIDLNLGKELEILELKFFR